jgi:Mg-chelatase subunit ChlD
VLSAIVLVALLAVCSLCINVNQVATARTEIRLACDAAAKAAAVELGQTQDLDAAREVARDIASRHKVSGASMQISEIDVEFGHSAAEPGGGHTFVAGGQPTNTVRVRTRLDDDAMTKRQAYFMAGILKPDTFGLDYTAMAARVDHDVCLVVDRSGSMAWDLSSEEWSYPDTEEQDDGSIIQRYFSVPDPANSRWAALSRSTEIFFEHLDSLPVDVRAGLVSYSSNFVFGLFESKASTIESELTTDYTKLNDAMQAIGAAELIGNTNIASGMQSAVDVLTGVESRITAKGTMVVLTDGIWNQGKDPANVASAAAAANITIHTITFSEQADQQKMAEVASIGGGKHYHAPDEESLRQIFAEIAQTLPAVLTQ